MSSGGGTEKGPPDVHRKRKFAAGAKAARKKRESRSKKVLQERLDKACSVLRHTVANPWVLAAQGPWPALRPLLQHFVDDPKRYLLDDPADRTELYASPGVVGTDGSGAIIDSDDSSGEGAAAVATAATAATAVARRNDLKTFVTAGVVKQLHSSASVRPTDPVFLVTVVKETKQMDNKFAPGHRFQHQLRLNVSDGEHTMLAVVATQAASRLKLTPGSIIKVTDYNCFELEVTQECTDKSLAMLILDAQRLCAWERYKDVPNKGMYIALDYWDTASDLPSATSGATNDAASPGSSPRDLTPNDGDAAGRLNVAPSDPRLKGISADDLACLGSDGFCNGSLCSVYGIATRQCLMKRTPVPEFEEIAHSCPWYEDAEMQALPNSKKRFVYYWWWAVNVFSIRGKKVRSELPACIVFGIRTLLPNEPGEEYTGFREADGNL